MSIILDALRKSERERRLGQIPTLDGGVPAPGTPRRTAVGVALAIALVGLLAGGAYWWMLPRSDDTEAAAPPPASLEVPKPQAAISTAAAPPAVSTSPRSEAGPLKAAAGEIPAALRAQLPALSLNALSWSEDPKRRFAMINQAILREGQQLPNGVVLREITRAGALLEFQGQQFTLRP